MVYPVPPRETQSFLINYGLHQMKRVRGTDFSCDFKEDLFSLMKNVSEIFFLIFLCLNPLLEISKS